MQNLIENPVISLGLGAVALVLAIINIFKDKKIFYFLSPFILGLAQLCNTFEYRGRLFRGDHYHVEEWLPFSSTTYSKVYVFIFILNFLALGLSYYRRKKNQKNTIGVSKKRAI